MMPRTIRGGRRIRGIEMTEPTLRQYRMSIPITKKAWDAAADNSPAAHFVGRHRGWHGRPYRRGKNRCAYCGAPIDAPDDPGWMAKALSLSAEYATLQTFKHSFGGV